METVAGFHLVWRADMVLDSLIALFSVLKVLMCSGEDGVIGGRRRRGMDKRQRRCSKLIAGDLRKRGHA